MAARSSMRYPKWAKRGGGGWTGYAMKSKAQRAAAFRAGRAQSRLRRRNIRTAGFLGIENKFYDTAVSKAALASGTTAMTGLEQDPQTVNCISAPAQGDTESSRDGRKIMINSILVQGVVSTENSASFERTPIVCVALVLDTQTNGAQLNSEDVYSCPGTDEINTAVPLRDMQHGSRFKILGFKRLVLRPYGAGFSTVSLSVTPAGAVSPFVFSKKLSLPVHFSSTTEGVANVQDNSLHVLAWIDSDSDAAAISYNARIRFTG